MYIDESKLMTFSKWWELNSVLYPNIDKAVAKTIWSAACDAVYQGMLEHTK